MPLFYVNQIVPDRYYFVNTTPVKIKCTRDPGWKRGYVDWVEQRDYYYNSIRRSIVYVSDSEKTGKIDLLYDYDTALWYIPEHYLRTEIHPRKLDTLAKENGQLQQAAKNKENLIQSIINAMEHNKNV